MAQLRAGSYALPTKTKRSSVHTKTLIDEGLSRAAVRCRCDNSAIPSGQDRLQARRRSGNKFRSQALLSSKLLLPPMCPSYPTVSTSFVRLCCRCLDFLSIRPANPVLEQTGDRHFDSFLVAAGSITWYTRWQSGTVASFTLAGCKAL
jgi:hypothetical protein